MTKKHPEEGFATTWLIFPYLFNLVKMRASDFLNWFCQGRQGNMYNNMKIKMLTEKKHSKW